MPVNDDATFEVHGGRVKVGLITDEFDEVGLVFSFEPDEDVSRYRLGYQHGQADYANLKAKYDREVEAHRENVKLLNAATARAHIAESKLREISEHFMDLHNIAKDVVGPKTKADSVAFDGKTVTIHMNSVSPEMMAMMTGQPLHDYPENW